MITLDDALNSHEFWHMELTNKDGTPVRCRKNGGVKTWATKPGLWRVPVKHGLKETFYIQNFDDRDEGAPAAGRGAAVGCNNAKDWCTTSKWAAEHVLYAGIEPAAPDATTTVRSQQLAMAKRAFAQDPTPALAATIRQLEKGHA